jgi:LacI family transcriptional regulator
VVSAVRGRVDGLIVMAPELDAENVHTHLPAGLPAVLLNCHATNAWSIAVDNVRAARSMMDHLGSLGHRRIAYIRGPEGNNDAAERLRGWGGALNESGVSQERLLFEGDFSETAGYDAAYAVMSDGADATAIFAGNDAMAIGALCALRELNIRVPEDMAVVGFDDIPLARFVSPPLTTISVDIAELGRRAFDLVLEAGEEDSTPRHAIVPTRLVIRESCGSRRPSGKTNAAVSRTLVDLT